MRIDCGCSRLLASVIVNANGCWEYQGTRTQNGYGALSFKGRRLLAHRLAYEQYVSVIPEGLEIDHLCRNRACVNPQHLEAVTHRVNVLRGTAPSARNATKTHCPQGHEYTQQNTIVKSGQRRCRECIKAEKRKAWSRADVREADRLRQRVCNMTPEQVEKQRARDRLRRQKARERRIGARTAPVGGAVAETNL